TALRESSKETSTQIPKTPRLSFRPSTQTDFSSSLPTSPRTTGTSSPAPLHRCSQTRFGHRLPSLFWPAPRLPAHHRGPPRVRLPSHRHHVEPSGTARSRLPRPNSDHSPAQRKISAPVSRK